MQNIVEADSVTLHMPNCIPDSHAKILQIAFLGIVPLVAVALSLSQQLYKRGVSARRLRDRRLQAGLVRVVVVVDLCS